MLSDVLSDFRLDKNFYLNDTEFSQGVTSSLFIRLVVSLGLLHREELIFVKNQSSKGSAFGN